MRSSIIILQDEKRRAHALKIVSSLALDELWSVTVEPYQPKRSSQANARLWALHTLAAEHVGCSPADMHEDMLCEHYGYQEVKMPSGIIKRIPLKRSHDRNKEEFRKFMDYCEVFYINRLGVFLEQ